MAEDVARTAHRTSEGHDISCLVLDLDRPYEARRDAPRRRRRSRFCLGAGADRTTPPETASSLIATLPLPGGSCAWHVESLGRKGLAAPHAIAQFVATQKLLVVVRGTGRARGVARAMRVG